MLVGIKLEVINTDTEIMDYPVYWMATVIDIAGAVNVFLIFLLIAPFILLLRTTVVSMQHS